MVGLLFLQVFKHDVDRVLEVFIVLPDFHGVDEFDQGGEVLFFYRGFIVDISDQGTVKQRLRFGPKLITGFTVAFGVGDQRGDELQDVLFTVDIGERVVVHRLLKVDRIQDPDLISVLLEGMAAFQDNGSLGALAVKTLNDLKTTTFNGI